jgi:hypothetical protein
VKINLAMTALAKLASLHLKPELLTQYETFLAALEEPDGVPDRIVQMCGLRIAAMRGEVDAWLLGSAGVGLDTTDIESIRRGAYESLTDAEQAALRLADRISFQWHDLTDQEVEAVTAHFGEAGCVGLMTAIAFIDANHRLDSALAPLEES